MYAQQVDLVRESNSSNMSDVGGGSRSNVVEFYRGSTVLITGASGFVGQVLLEKLLRSLEVRKIYVTIRAKRSLSAEDRLQRILKGLLFDRLRQDAVRWQEVVDKVVPVEIRFDASAQEMAGQLSSLLREEVNVVFNLLASVNFNEPLDCALRTNVEYTDRLLGMVSEMKQLKAVIHVSTFYSNCDRSVVEERIYDDIGFGGVTNVMNVVSKLSGDEVQLMTPHLIGNFPNTYTFSKKCAEVMIQEKYRSLPVGVFRPPIVSSTYSEPVPAWIDNFNGPSGMVFPVSEGLYCAALLDSQKRPFIVPVDYCVNALLTSAADVHLHRSRRSSIPVYNYTDTSCNLTWRQIVNLFIEGLPPLKRVVTTTFSGTVTGNSWRYGLCKGLMRLQGFLLDVVLQVRGRTPIMRQLFERMIALNEVLRFFCFNEWRMRNDNVRRMRAEASEEEAKVFPFDLSEVDWNVYYRNFVGGVGKYAIEPRKARHGKGKVAPKMEEGKRSGFFYLVWSFVFRYAMKIYNYLF